jgi:hypothetical protein
VTDSITHDRIDEGFTELNTWHDDTVGCLKEPARTWLASLLSENIPTPPLTKAELTDLLARARTALTRQVAS